VKRSEKVAPTTPACRRTHARRRARLCPLSFTPRRAAQSKTLFHLRERAATKNPPFLDSLFFFKFSGGVARTADGVLVWARKRVVVGVMWRDSAGFGGVLRTSRNMCRRQDAALRGSARFPRQGDERGCFPTPMPLHSLLRTVFVGAGAKSVALVAGAHAPSLLSLGRRLQPLARNQPALPIQWPTIGLT